MKMITIHHKRDVKFFKQAIKFSDKEVSTFAQTYLPMIQSHVDKINSITSLQKTTSKLNLPVS